MAACNNYMKVILRVVVTYIACVTDGNLPLVTWSRSRLGRSQLYRLPDSGEYLVFHIPDSAPEIEGTQSGDGPENTYYKTICVKLLCVNTR